jgi:glycosyltransferase involved in cell wall biosynthesis
MKVAILTENITFGGVNRYCLTLAKGLTAYPQVEPQVLALPSTGDDWLLREADRLGIRVEVLGEVPVRALRRLISERGIDVVHTNGYRANVITRLALCCGGPAVKHVCTVHGAHYFASAALRSKGYYALDYLTMFRQDAVIAVSAATASKVSRWVRGDRLAVIHNGTGVFALAGEPERLAQRKALGIPAHAKVVCFVGRFDPQKGMDALTQTMASVLAGSEDLVFLLVGDGRSWAQVEATALGFGARVIMTGLQRDVDPYFVASDMVFFPSSSEGLPLALLEASAHGLPAVASNVGGVPEVIVEGHNGFLCDRHDTDTMARRIMQLAHDDELRARMGGNARDRVATSFTISGMTEATHRAYLSLGKSLR